MCFDKRQKPSVIVAVLSGIVAALGVLMIVESVLFNKKDSIFAEDFGGELEKY